MLKVDGTSVPETIEATAGDSSQLIQLLNQNGERVSHPEFDSFVAEISSEELKQFYRDMALARRYDREATALQRQGELALWVPLWGQEAAQVGAARASTAKDYLFPTYREHAVALIRGITPEELIKLFRGISHGGWDPRQSKFHIYTLVLAAQTLHAVGYAMGVDRDRKLAQAQGQEADTEAVMAFFGDGSSSEGDVHESMVFAASYNAPVVFFCQNNQWAISVPFEVQSKVPLAQRAQGYGFPGVRVDGNDVLAVYAVTRWALERARHGEGPVLIEAQTYRMGAHTTADDPTKYRCETEEQLWAQRDPLERLEKLLRGEGHADQDFFDQVSADADVLAKELRAAMQVLEKTDLQDVFRSVYAQAHPLVTEEAQWLAEYQQSFIDAEGDNAATGAGEK